mgnify:CR=1 FL=1
MKRFDLINKAYSSGLMNAEEIAEVFSYPKFEVIETLLRQGHCQCCIDRKFTANTNEQKYVNYLLRREERLQDTWEFNRAKLPKTLKKKSILPKPPEIKPKEDDLWQDATPENMQNLENQANEMMKDYKLPFFQDEE